MMTVNVCFVSAMLLITLSAIIAIITELKQINHYLWTGRNIFILGTFLSAIFILFPLYRFDDAHWFSAISASILHAARLFVFGPEFDKISEVWRNFPLYYMIAVAAYHFIAPALSASVILSFAKYFVALVRYYLNFNKDVHIFSELNEKTLALGKNLYEKYNGPNRKKDAKSIAIVYTDVIYANDEAHIDLIEGAKEIKAILFTKDILSIRLKRTKPHDRNIKFYLISDNEREKVRHLDSLIKLYENNENASLYIFSDGIEIKCFLNQCLENKRNPETKKYNIAMQIFRIDDIKLLIYHNLDEYGIRLFENAVQLSDGTREISAVVIGFGKYGQEVTKALLWYCQVPRYRVKITVLDESETAESEFRAMCPEIRIGENVNGANDMRYTIHFRKATFGMNDFYSELEKIGTISYAFVCLGDDSRNIAAATGIKERMAQQKKPLSIETILYEPCLKQCLAGNVRAFGDLQSFYSEDAVIEKNLINEGLEVHLRWSDDENDPNEKIVYHMKDYNYYSSLASALHRRLRREIKNHPNIFPFFANDPLVKELLPCINDNAQIKKLSKEMKRFSNCLYVRTTYHKYLQLLPEERKNVLDRLQEKIGTEPSDIPMYADKQEYLAGYEECLKKLRFNDNSTEDTVKHLNKIRDCMIERLTENETDALVKREIALSFEWNTFPEQIQADIFDYITEKLGMSYDQIMQHLRKAHLFADIEHIRWNAYVRSEGFRLSVKTDKPNKLHFDLVPSDRLTVADCIKDI